MSDDDCTCDDDGRFSPADLDRDADATDRLSTIFGALAEPRRRYLLYHLSEKSGEVAERSELVAVVRDAEAAAGDGADGPSADAVTIDLQHGQLPHLDDAGLIDYDHRQGTVRYRERQAVEECLERARAVEFDCAT